MIELKEVFVCDCCKETIGLDRKEGFAIIHGETREEYLYCKHCAQMYTEQCSICEEYYAKNSLFHPDIISEGVEAYCPSCIDAYIKELKDELENALYYVEE
jgi:hypothetical protein